jgi:hypothetical protein
MRSLQNGKGVTAERQGVEAQRVEITVDQVMRSEGRIDLL